MELVRGLKKENRALGYSSKKFTVMEYIECGKELYNKTGEALKNHAKISRFYLGITRKPPDDVIAVV